jgi:hypothetical protein
MASLLFLLLAVPGLGPGDATHPASPGGGITYPGTTPGPLVETTVGPQFRLGTEAIKVTWAWSPVGLRRTAVTGRGGLDFPLSGEAFQVGLSDGRRYLASKMVPVGPPRVVKLAPDPASPRLARRIPGRQVELTLRTDDGRLRVVWRASARVDGNAVREEIELHAENGDVPVGEIVWLDERLEGASTAGTVDGSPVVAGNLFLGAEDPMARNTVNHDGATRCRLVRNTTLRRGEVLTSGFVIGVAPPGQMRRAFLYDLERERAHPYRPFLHYNAWYDIAWMPFALNEANCTEAIRLFGERFIQRHSVVMDALVFDDGWDDPRTLWRFHAGFPHGFAPLAALCASYHTRLGVWLSPFGGYGTPKEERLRFGRSEGFETNATGFSLAGPKYYDAFKRACVGMIEKYRVVHFKFDGIATGALANGGGDYVRDTEAMRRLMVELRAKDPALYINLTTGSWPSPYWLRFADSLWRQGGDMGLAGKGTHQQQWLTYRDQEVYRNIVHKGPLYPLNALMTQGVAYSRQGSAGDPTFNSAGFRDDVHAFFGSGTGLQELYIQPGKLTDDDWRILAEAAKWSRANADVLVDTHWIGGDPSKGEVYGYASWSPRKGVVMLRNPDDRSHEFALDLGTAFELPPGAPTHYRLRSPWADDHDKPSLAAAAGTPLCVALQPFEAVVLDAAP